MGLSEQNLKPRQDTAVFSQKNQDVVGHVAEVFHEGQQVRIRVCQRRDERAMMIPLRNGFPLYATDRSAQCFTVIDSQARKVASAIRIRDFGLHLMFDHPPARGDYFILTQTIVGHA